MLKIVIKLLVVVFFFEKTYGLYPFATESRSVISLNGIWYFKVDFNNEGIENDWQKKSFKNQLNDTLKIAVPSSYNDLYTNASIRNHIGWVWYNRDFRLQNEYIASKDNEIILRIASCHYFCIVWLNNEMLGTHESGHLPFEFDITDIVVSESNQIFNLVIAVNNTLDVNTIPPAGISYGDSINFPPNFVQQTLQMDFFNFAGIHRDVILYIKPAVNIQEVTVTTDYFPDTQLGKVNFEVITNCDRDLKLNVSILDQEGAVLSLTHNPVDSITLKDPKLWWPRYLGKSKTYGYLHTLKIDMVCEESFYDSYAFEFGIRSISWSKTSSDNSNAWLINSEPFYCHGVNRHEDFPVIGRGIDLATLVKDVYLLDWLNINCIRTSHYPYAEEFYQFADQMGIAVIDEVPAVGFKYAQNFNKITNSLHKQLLSEMYDRDKNHPSVVMWSLANEASVDLDPSVPYFIDIFAYMRTLDQTRPLSMTMDKTFEKNKCGNLSDIIMLNRYFGWYQYPGHLDTIGIQMTNELNKWSTTYQKPIIISEYGADAMPGVHCYPEQLFCEEYQESLLRENHATFDELKSKGILYGELIWNLIEFMTGEDTNILRRVYGNRKGMFTRDREPKSAAFILKNRYENLKNKA